MNKIVLGLVISWQLIAGAGQPVRGNGTYAQARFPVTGADSLWLQVDSLAKAGLPNSALAIVDKLYVLAKEQQDTPEIIKAILNRISLESTFQENFPIPAIRQLQQEIASSGEPATQILHSILGELYWNYFQRNQYRLVDRSFAAGNPSEDPQTWDATRIIYEIILNYRQSLANETMLQGTPLNRFQAILEMQDPGSGKIDTARIVPSTLFDFLAQRALEFFTQTNLPVIQSAGAFSLDHEAYFFPPEKFIKYPLQPKGIHARPGDGAFIPAGADTLSLPWYAIRIFQSLAQFHLNDKNPDDLIHWELQRLAYVLGKSTLPERDSLYIQALRQFEESYVFSPASSRISYALAQALMNEGSKYDPTVSASHRWAIKSALQVCLAAVQRYPGSAGSADCRSLIRLIEAPSLQVTSEYAIVPEKPALASITFKNIPVLHFRLVQADPEKYKAAISGLRQDEVFGYLITLKPVKEWHVNLPETDDYRPHTTECMIPPLSPGCYLMIASADSLFRNPAFPFSYQEIWSTGISYITQRNESGGMDIYLLGRQSGFPLKNLVVEAFTKSYDARNRRYVTTKAGEYRSDESGFFSIPAPQGRGSYTNLILHISNGSDRLVTQPLYVYPATEHTDRPVEQTRFFTDRAIYRPSQPIYFKGIMLVRTGDSTSLKENKKTLVTFSDANGQKIGDQWFTTDSYGAFNGSFTAPTGVLLGEMRISNESGSITFSVEEYKRPTFEVIFNPLEGNYMLGESMTITGKATGFSGNAIDGGSVSYRVVRTVQYPFRGGWWRIPFPQSPEVEITNGMTSTLADGTFSIIFEAIPDKTIPAGNMPVFTYRVVADITDINGETRSAQESVTVGYTSMLIHFNIPENVNIAAWEPFVVTTTNLNGQPTPADVRVTLEKLSPPDRTFKSRLWSRPDTELFSREEFYRLFPHDIYEDDNNPETWAVEGELFDGMINTSTDSLLYLTGNGSRVAGEPDQASGIRHPASGITKPGFYRLALAATDPFGQQVKKVCFFTAFDPSGKKIPAPACNWFVPLKSSGVPGESASFLIGTSEKEIRVIREIRVKGELASREWVTLKNQQKMIEIPILEEYRGNFSVSFLFVCDNRVFQNNQLVTVPYPDKQLDITISTFRDKLLPGRQEEWKIRITDAAKQGVVASLLATMYDRSLDLFRSNEWSFDLYRRYYYSKFWDVNDDFRTTGGSWYPSLPGTPGIPDQDFIRLNWFGLQSMGFGYYMDGGLKSGWGTRTMLPKDAYAMEAAPAVAGMQEPPPPMENINELENKSPGQNRAPENQTTPIIPVRTNFRETAFFYPSLLTDSTGGLVLKFTVPDALTSWKILGLAYTRQLDYGLLEKEVVTQKDLMVFPNAPRFVRQGDTVVVMARIVNLSDHEISGEASLSLTEAITMQPLNSLILEPGYRLADPASKTPDPKAFTLLPGQSVSVSWTLAIPVSRFLGLLQYTMTAQAGTFSDGETNTIPVLTNSILVTETLPLPVSGTGSFDFRFDKLLQSAELKSLKNYRLTLEFTSNPAWYAIQSLPSLSLGTNKNSDQVFSAFYANALGSHIVNTNPGIQQVFESWRRFTPDALLSTLEKNESLKTAILQETPWVTEARDETENKRKIGLFFDLNTVQHSLQENLSLLQKMQYPSGGWPWFEGMRENRVVTLAILTGIGRLDHLGVRFTQQDERIAQMVSRAIQYLDAELLEDFEKLHADYPDKLDENHLTPVQIKYLYARSLFGYAVGPYPSGEGKPDAGSGTPDEPGRLSQALDYYTAQAAKFWLKQSLYSQGMIALALSRRGDQQTALNIMKSLSERALHSPEMGMYWAGDRGYEWYQVPVETQALLIEAYDEVSRDKEAVEQMKIWLLKQKQTQRWATGQGTVDACYALLLRGDDLLAENPQVKIDLGDQKVDPSSETDLSREAGTGYFSRSWTGDEIRPGMGQITVTKSSGGIAWGGLYWQYFENLDRITAHETPMSVEKQIFLVKNSDAADIHHTTTPHHPLEVGDKLKVRLVVTVDRTMEFVHLKDLRAAGLEPLPLSPSPKGAGGYPEGLSGYRYQDGLGYYQSTTDLATHFYFDLLPEGVWVFEYPLVVNNAGDFSAGIATIQCMYAPEFSAHSEGGRMIIK